jgi:hypothetical protein
VTVSATNLDIRDLTFATDSVTAYQGGTWSFSEASPNGATLASSVTVGTSAVALPASALAARKYMDVQNLSDKPIYIGDSAVTVGSGLLIPKGGNKEIEVGPSQVIYAIAASAGLDVRVYERA